MKEIAMIVRKIFISAIYFSVLSLFVIVLPQVIMADIPSANEIQLIPNLPSGQPVGSVIIWTVVTPEPDLCDYRFMVGLLGEPLKVIYDFTFKNEFEWASIDEGIYVVRVSVRDLSTGEIIHVQQVFKITPRARWRPVVTSTEHPLVALYSAPPNPSGGLMRVVFWKLDGTEWFVTNTKPISPGRSINFYIAGMQPKSFYAMRHEVLDEEGKIVEYGRTVFHRTGRLPKGFKYFPERQLMDPPDHQTSIDEKVLLFSAGPFAVATNLFGQVVWYDNASISDGVSYVLMRPVKGGTFLFIHSDQNRVEGQILREIDLAGHTVRETNAGRIREQLTALGQEPLWAFHHDARRLPNGYTAVIGSVERIVEDAQSGNLVDILGDYVVVLDENWQVIWAWNAFHHLDVTRGAILGQQCKRKGRGPGCPPLFLDDEANDWTHSNAVTYSPADGNLLLSIRHQDWIIKIDYQDGTGTGEIIWRLGPEGDFSIASGDPRQWFTHPHDPNYAGENKLVVFDNGNTRCHYNPDLCFSRGQVYIIDEKSKIAYLYLNANLGTYNPALGSAQGLLNGNFHFNAGVNLSLFPFERYGTSTEILPEGTPSYSMRFESIVYKSFRMRDLYSIPSE
jgi:hypothetical protein